MNRNLTICSWTFSRIAACGIAAASLLGQAVFGQTIPNPSFEADTFTNAPGYVSLNKAITGWTASPPNHVGLNPAGGTAFANNGAVPAGTNVAFLESNYDDPTTPSTLSTTISGLTVGTTYKMTFRANATSGQTPNVKVYIDGVAVLLPGGPDGFSTAAVTGSNPYWHVAFEFQAAAASQMLSVVNDASGTNTLLVDDFQIAPTSGRFTVAPWTSDADSGVSATNFYTHAFNFGRATNAVINSVTFLGVAGANPSFPGRFTTTYLGNVYNGDNNALTIGGDGSAVLAGDFVYGGNVPAGQYQSITMQGLTPGAEYVVTIYSLGWEAPSLGSRWVTFNMGNDYLTVNQDAYGSKNGITVSYRYTADATGTATLYYAPLVPANVSFHTYGFSNRATSPANAAPIIISQPTSLIAAAGLSSTFSVTALGYPLPTYQWNLNGVPIAGATNNTYSVTAAAAAAGAYGVTIANAAGSATSSVARLTVGLAMTNPSFETDLFATWPGYVSANGPITGWNALGGHGLNPVAGGSSPFADNGAIPDGSQVAFMQADGILSQVVSGFTVGAQYYVHYYENARTGATTPSLAVQVGSNLVLTAHNVLPVGGGNPYHEISTAVFVATNTDLELDFIKASPQGGDCTALIDDVAIVAVPPGTPPVLSLQPLPLTVYLGQPASFSVVAQGSLPLSYQWWLGTNMVAGATNATLSLAGVHLYDEGNYTVVVANSSGSVTSVVARLSLLEAVPSLHNTGIDAAGNLLPGGALDPLWTLRANPDSGSASVFVGTNGFPGAWLANSTTSEWVGPRTTLGDADIAAGDYVYRTTFDLTGRDTNTVQIVGRWASDNWGTAVAVNGTPVTVPTSFNYGSWTTFIITHTNVAFLQGTNTLDFTVNNSAAGATGLRLEFTQTSARTLPGIAPGIAVQPQGVTAVVGDTVVFNVTATGTLPLGYQWLKNGAPLSGQTGTSLTLSGVTTADSGNYAVTVSNLWGVAVSSNALLNVAYRTIPGIYGTGVDATGALLPDGVVDPNYILTVSADPNFPGPDAFVVTNVWPIQLGTWLPNGPNSRWIAPNSDQEQNIDPTQGNMDGLYTYQTSFNLTGYDLSQVQLVGGWAVDNYGVDILINGVSTGSTNSVGFGSLTPFTFTSTNGLVAGSNTLAFIVNNLPVGPNPTGLRVDLRGLVPVTAPPTVTITVSGSTVSIAWSPAKAGQKLLSAPAVTGPWTVITGAANPYTTTLTGAKMFFRVSQ